MKRLVKQAKNGDGNAFARLIRESETTLYRVAASYLRSEADIADAVQDTVLSAWEHIGTLRRPEYFKTWLIRILINHCCRILRNNKRVIPFEELPELASDYKEQSNLAFEEMMNCLSENNRIVLTLFYGEDLTVKEIASILEISENAVRQRLHRGRMEVKENYLCETVSPDKAANPCGRQAGKQKLEKVTL